MADHLSRCLEGIIRSTVLMCECVCVSFLPVCKKYIFKHKKASRICQDANSQPDCFPIKLLFVIEREKTQKQANDLLTYSQTSVSVLGNITHIQHAIPPLTGNGACQRGQGPNVPGNSLTVQTLDLFPLHPHLVALRFSSGPVQTVV